MQPYTQQPLILYQIETVPVPIIDKNTKANSYTENVIKKPYLALNLETYINIHQQELATCKKIGYEFYCEELFVVRHKSILNRPSRQVNDGGNNSAQSANHGVQSKGHIVIPYTQGLCESIKKICGRYGIQTHFKGGRTIKNLLVSPKDKDPMVNQSGAIYWYQCGDLGCDDEYIGETSRTFGERYKEHLKAPSAIHHHSIQTDHTTNQNNFQIIGREGHNLARNIKESIYMRVNNPSLNNNIGKFNLSSICNRVLINTKGLTLK